MSLIPRPLPLVATCSLFAAALAPLSAADNLGIDSNYPRVGAEVLFGTSGFEPGITAAWRFHSGASTTMIVRPEVTISEDGRPGAALSVDWNLDFFNLPRNQTLAIGPRIAYHNSDDHGWEGSLFGLYSFDFMNDHPGHHFFEIIGAAGIVEDKSNDNDKATRFAGTIGVGYAYQF
jgi:hypothetical protein